ncbi:hypothetical protein F5X99DRAFT_431173 [Biscogniauxia marginata]|nr:hypothetical protein F5X99DRAFT_431173 [Biscogniauxia marginata]
MQFFISRMLLALAGLGLLGSTLALPGAIASARVPQDSSPDPLYIRPGFVSTRSADAYDHHGQPQLFTSTFEKQDNQTFLCQVDTIEPATQRTLTSDCQQLLKNLLDMPGFWSCHDWELGQYHPLVGYRSCQFQVSRSDSNEPAFIGNGDVYATLYLALDIATQNGTVEHLGFHGTDICGPSPAAVPVNFAI